MTLQPTRNLHLERNRGTMEMKGVDGERRAKEMCEQMKGSWISKGYKEVRKVTQTFIGE